MNYAKRMLGISVLEAAEQRISYCFDHFDRIYTSFSAGKDSTSLLHLACAEARRRGRKIGVLLVDLEGQYRLTIEHAERCFETWADVIEPYWLCLPISLRNAVSQFQAQWICWDPAARAMWVREPPALAITDPAIFPWFRHGMEFEDLVVDFGRWYAQGEPCACLVAIRTAESLNRWRTIASDDKTTYDGRRWTTVVVDKLVNAYPIYDWSTRDIWVHAARFAREGLPYNRLYDRFHQAGLKLSQMRICQPYGDDQRKGLWLYQIIEPETWGRLIARVNGANYGAIYAQERGSILGVYTISKPDHLTWEQYCVLLLETMPAKRRDHYKVKIAVFLKWWSDRGHPNGIPDEADRRLEAAKKAPSWRCVCRMILRLDYWCKILGFSPHRSGAYDRYREMMRNRLGRWETKSAPWKPHFID